MSESKLGRFELIFLSTMTIVSILLENVSQVFKMSGISGGLITRCNNNYHYQNKN